MADGNRAKEGRRERMKGGEMRREEKTGGARLRIERKACLTICVSVRVKEEGGC